MICFCCHYTVQTVNSPYPRHCQYPSVRMCYNVVCVCTCRHVSVNDCVRLCLCVCAPMHVSVRVHEFALVCVLPGPGPVLVCLCQNAAPFRPFNRLSAWLPVLSTDWPVKALAVTMHYLTNPQATGFYCKYMLCHGLLPPPPSLLLWALFFFSPPFSSFSLYPLPLVPLSHFSSPFPSL